MTATLETSEVSDYDLSGKDSEFVADLAEDLVQLQFWMDRTLGVRPCPPDRRPGS